VTKTIGLSDAAYGRLAAMKKPGESFSEVVLRVSGAHALVRLAGTMDARTAAGYKRAIEEARRREDRQRGARTRRLWRP
jgi:predicted CopG family antitoxin